MEETVLQEMDTYFSHHQNTDAQFTATSPIMDLVLAAERPPGSRVAKRWWGQEGLELEEMCMVAREAEQEDRGGGYGRDGNRDR